MRKLQVNDVVIYKPTNKICLITQITKDIITLRLSKYTTTQVCPNKSDFRLQGGPDDLCKWDYCTNALHDNSERIMILSIDKEQLIAFCLVYNYNTQILKKEFRSIIGLIKTSEFGLQMKCKIIKTDLSNQYLGVAKYRNFALNHLVNISYANSIETCGYDKNVLDILTSNGVTKVLQVSYYHVQEQELKNIQVYDNEININVDYLFKQKSIFTKGTKLICINDKKSAELKKGNKYEMISVQKKHKNDIQYDIIKVKDLETNKILLNYRNRFQTIDKKDNTTTSEVIYKGDTEERISQRPINPLHINPVRHTRGISEPIFTEFTREVDPIQFSNQSTEISNDEYQRILTEYARVVLGENEEQIQRTVTALIIN